MLIKGLERAAEIEMEERGKSGAVVARAKAKRVAGTRRGTATEGEHGRHRSDLLGFAPVTF